MRKYILGSIDLLKILILQQENVPDLFGRVELCLCVLVPPINQKRKNRTSGRTRELPLSRFSQSYVVNFVDNSRNSIGMCDTCGGWAEICEFVVEDSAGNPRNYKTEVVSFRRASWHDCIQIKTIIVLLHASTSQARCT